MTDFLPSTAFRKRLRTKSIRTALTLVALGVASMPLLAYAALAARQTAATSEPGTVVELLNKLPDATRTTVSACQAEGGVNLAIGDQNGSVICNNGSLPDVSYDRYVTTLADILAASALIGFRTAITADPQATPEMLMGVLTSPEGEEAVRTAMTSAIATSQLVPADSPESVSLLTNEVLKRLLPTLQQTNNLRTLTGTETQYNQVVQEFCTPQGMSVEQVQEVMPELSSIQLYAICIQASGIGGVAP